MCAIGLTFASSLLRTFLYDHADALATRDLYLL